MKKYLNKTTWFQWLPFMIVGRVWWSREAYKRVVRKQ
jgi:hypothetical protein